MRFQTELVPARLLRRYKRFLADCVLQDGQEITAHCPNPGSMLGLAEPGTRIWLEPNCDPRKKLKFGWRLVETAEGGFVGIDTSAANKIVKEALLARQVAPLAAYTDIATEVMYHDNSRADFVLGGTDLPTAYLEVKSVTLSRTRGRAEFPDSVTARGAKHLEALSAMARQGHRAINLFCVQRSDCTHVQIAEDLDPGYADAMRQATKTGVEVLCYATALQPSGCTLATPLPFTAP